MSHHFENVLEQVHQLSRFEQLKLISTIAKILVAEETEGLPKYIIDENRRRLAAYDAKETKGIPYKEAMSYVRTEVNESR
jgi:hypothetical protein